MGSYLKMAPHREGGAGSGARLESASLGLCSDESEQLDGSPIEYSESAQSPGDAESDVEV
jgi:hypothetical protein